MCTSLTSMTGRINAYLLLCALYTNRYDCPAIDNLPCSMLFDGVDDRKCHWYDQDGTIHDRITAVSPCT